jgi:Tfp pilus assembly protein PilF
MSYFRYLGELSFLCLLIACGTTASRGETLQPRDSIDTALDDSRSPVPPASEQVRQGEKHLAANDIEKAQALFERAIRDNPNDARAHLDLGISLETRNDLEGAEREYRTAIAIQSDFAEALNNLGVLLRIKGHLDESISTSRKAVQYNRGTASGHMNLALALEDSGQLKQAEAEYREALRIEPSDAITRANLGLLLLKLKRSDSAIQELTTALPHASDNRAALVAIGNGLRRAGESSLAVQAMQAAIRAGDGKATPAILSELALAQRAAGEREAAITSLRNALEIDENYAIAHYLIANMLAATRKNDEAAKHYQIYLRLNPEGPQADRARERLKLVQ